MVVYVRTQGWVHNALAQAARRVSYAIRSLINASRVPVKTTEHVKPWSINSYVSVQWTTWELDVNKSVTPVNRSIHVSIQDDALFVQIIFRAFVMLVLRAPTVKHRSIIVSRIRVWTVASVEHWSTVSDAIAFKDTM